MPVTKLQLFNRSTISYDFDMTIQYDTPGVKFLAISHDDRVSSVYSCKDHCTAQCMARRHCHVAKCLQQQQILTM